MCLTLLDSGDDEVREGAGTRGGGDEEEVRERERVVGGADLEGVEKVVGEGRR